MSIARAEPDAAPEADPVDAVRRRLGTIDWYHTQELAPGLVTPGMFDLRPYVDRYGIPADLSGKRVLDVGTFEGFWAFELERRGEGFELARAALGSSVRRVGMSIYDADPAQLGGTFDLVFCGSVLIHLRDPMLALERMAALSHDRLILADEYSRRLAWLPFAAAEFRGETPWSTWWRPSPRAWLAMVRCAGFDDVRTHGRFRMKFREGRDVVPHLVIHARKPG